MYMYLRLIFFHLLSVRHIPVTYTYRRLIFFHLLSVRQFHEERGSVLNVTYVDDQVGRCVQSQTILQHAYACTVLCKSMKYFYVELTVEYLFKLDD